MNKYIHYSELLRWIARAENRKMTEKEILDSIKELDNPEAGEGEGLLQEIATCGTEEKIARAQKIKELSLKIGLNLQGIALLSDKTTFKKIEKRLQALESQALELIEMAESGLK